MEPLCLASLPSVMFSRLVLVVSPRLFWVCCVFIVWIDPILLTCSSAGRHLHCPPWRRGWLQVLTYSSVRMLCPTRGVAPLLVLSDCSSGHSLWSWVMAWASCQVPVLAQVASVELLGDCVHAEGSPGPVGQGGAPLQSWFPHLNQSFQHTWSKHIFSRLFYAALSPAPKGSPGQEGTTDSKTALLFPR